MNVLKDFVYQKALERRFHTSFFTKQHKVNRLFCIQKPALNVKPFKGLWYTVNPTQIWYDKFS